MLATNLRKTHSIEFHTAVARRPCTETTLEPWLPSSQNAHYQPRYPYFPFAWTFLLENNTANTSGNLTSRKQSTTHKSRSLCLPKTVSYIMFPNKCPRYSEGMPAAPRRVPSQEVSWRPDTQAEPPAQQSKNNHLAPNQRYSYITPIPPNFLPHEMFRQQAGIYTMNRSAPLSYTSDNSRVRQTVKLEEPGESLMQANPTASVVESRKLRQISLVNAFMDQGPKSMDWLAEQDMRSYFMQLVEEADEATARQVKSWEEETATNLNQKR
jgi:hypothetical protein